MQSAAIRGVHCAVCSPLILQLMDSRRGKKVYAKSIFQGNLRKSFSFSYNNLGIFVQGQKYNTGICNRRMRKIF